MPESQVKAAVVGLGRIASLLEGDSLREKPCTHCGAMAANPDCTLVAGADTDGDRRELFSQTWQVPTYADAAEMLKTHRPDLLTIATHPDSHYRYCRLAFDLGIPVVVCEKPLAPNLAEARSIAGLVGPGFTVITNHERRYSADWIRAKAILAGGELGRLLSVHATLYMGREKPLLDVLWHDGTHLADAVMFLTDSTLRHRKRWGAKLRSTSGTAWLEGYLEGDRNGKPRIPVVLEAGAGRDHLVFQVQCSCERGRLDIGNGIFRVWESRPSPYAEHFRSLAPTPETFSGPTGFFATMLADAIACVRNPALVPKSSAADGLRVVKYLSSLR